MKRLPIVAVLALLLAAAPIFADTMDDAEAKRRGVAVEVVQLERTKQQVADLTAQVTSLKAQLAAAKAPPSAPSTVPAAKVGVAPEMALAIKEHRLIKGMTVPQMKSAIEGNWRMDSDRDDVQTWVCRWWKDSTETQRGGEFEVASADVSKGIVVSCETKKSIMDLETMVGNGPYAVKPAPARGTRR